MRAVVQRVVRASVTVESTIVGAIEKGLLVYLGVGRTDTTAVAAQFADKILGLRLFTDAADKMNLDVTEVSGSLLVVSQFTLYGDVRKGRRPGFDAAMPPDEANVLYEHFVAHARAKKIATQTGVFRAHMLVDAVNDGPINILVDSDKLF